MITIKAYYIKQADKPNAFMQLINYVSVKDKYITIQPFPQNVKDKRLYNTAQKIHKICRKSDVQSIVINKKSQQNSKFKDYLYAFNIDIFDGSWLWKYMAYETINYILEKAHKSKEKTEISILTNNLTNETIENIKTFAKEFKRLNIITNQINSFKYIEKKIYDEYGMMITVTNNKKRSLEKAEIILNFDFTDDLINQYSIYEKAIIINFKEKTKIKKKRFNGLNINNYEITSIHENDNFDFENLNNFYLRDLLEAKLYRKSTFANIRQDITKDYYKIKELYGNNGICTF